jgi:hypothetical protein
MIGQPLQTPHHLVVEPFLFKPPPGFKFARVP